MTGPTKLIEVALPLDDINREAAREKSIRHGHPSTLHLWWARRPLAACRAVLFAQLVDDPSAHPDLFASPEAVEAERERLFDVIRRLVKWENSSDSRVLDEARAEIRRCYPTGTPSIVDPFCGGGSIPLEAQRLGLHVQASDLNPVPVLITKALIELPSKFADRPPVCPGGESQLAGTRTWRGAQGLAEDVRRYGQWMFREAESRLGRLYPRVELSDGTAAPAIAWIWARTVCCPNPACGSTMPLVRSFWLGKKRGKEAWVKAIPDVSLKRVRFEIGHGSEGPSVDGTVLRTGAQCLVCDTPVSLEYIRQEGRDGRLGSQLMATVAQGDRQRIYLAPSVEQEGAANIERPDDAPDTMLPEQALGFRVQAYGMTHHADLFTPRQLTALCTLADLVGETRSQALAHSNGDAQYADAIATYMAFAVSRCADYGSTITSWASHPKQEAIRNTFGRQALPMTWDYGEANFLGPAAGSLEENFSWIAKVLERLMPAAVGLVEQRDATSRSFRDLVLCTDPPYYDNIGYADLSDFFYIWLRRSLRSVYPELLATMLTPKAEELIATPYRFEGSKARAEQHFEAGFGEVFAHAAAQSPTHTPMTIFYAFKQSESEDDERGDSSTASTGWEKMLDGLIRSGLTITGTWPMRTELSNRMVSSGTNALASSIVLACRRRPEAAGVTDRRGFLNELKLKLKDAVRNLQSGGVAPVDLAQASIGPGMAVFSAYAKVVEPDGSPMRVRTALALINQVLDEVSAEQEGEFDEETRWATAWFSEFGFDAGAFGRADDLARAKNVAVDGLVRAGIAEAQAGKVRLLERAELDREWDPVTDKRLTVWEVTQHLIDRLLGDGGEREAARLVSKVGGLAEPARDLAYRLFEISERRGWSKEAAPYNALAAAWPELTRMAASGEFESGQGSML